MTTTPVKTHILDEGALRADVIRRVEEMQRQVSTVQHYAKSDISADRRGHGLPSSTELSLEVLSNQLLNLNDGSAA